MTELGGLLHPRGHAGLTTATVSCWLWGDVEDCSRGVLAQREDPPPPPLWAEEQVCSLAFPTLVPFHSLLLGTSSLERKLAALPRASGLAQPTASAPSAETTPAPAWDGRRGLGRPVLHVLWARWERRAAVHTWRRLWGRPRAGGQLRRPHWALLLETAPWGAQWGFPLGYLQQE